MGPLATLLSRFEVAIALAVSIAAGIIVAASVDKSDATAAGIVGIVLIGAWIVLRMFSTDFGLCVMAWEAGTTFAERTPLSVALRAKTRRWIPLEFDLPDAVPLPWHRLEGMFAEADKSCTMAGRHLIGAPRIAVVPATRTHCGFALGRSMRSQIADFSVEIWGRVVMSDDHNRVRWGKRLILTPRHHAAVFNLVPAPLVVGAGVARGILVVSPRRIPMDYWDKKTGTPDVARYVDENRDGCLVVVASAGVDRNPDSHDIVMAAVMCRSYARAIRRAGPTNRVALRLVCGEAESFALGLLIGSLCEFDLEVWSKVRREWLPWTSMKETS